MVANTLVVMPMEKSKEKALCIIPMVLAMRGRGQTTHVTDLGPIST